MGSNHRYLFPTFDGSQEPSIGAMFAQNGTSAQIFGLLPQCPPQTKLHEYVISAGLRHFANFSIFLNLSMPYSELPLAMRAYVSNIIRLLGLETVGAGPSTYIYGNYGYLTKISLQKQRHPCEYCSHSLFPGSFQVI